MMTRPVARTFTALSVATLVILGLAPAAAAKEHHYQGSVSELKANCKEVGGTFSSSKDGTSGICATDKSVKFCTDKPGTAAPSGNNCVNYYRKVPIRKVLGLLRDFGLLTRGASGPSQPATGGGSTATTTSPSSTSTSTTVPSTTTTTGPSFL
jgi:hypothetical protein